MFYSHERTFPLLNRLRPPPDAQQFSDQRRMEWPLSGTHDRHSLVFRSNGAHRIVATLGPKSAAKKVTRRQIQGVNVPKTCQKIQHPGAPIALRLQSNLL